MSLTQYIYELFEPWSPWYESSEITINDVFINNDVMLYKPEKRIHKLSSSRFHVWFLESDIIFPNAKCYFDDKSFITSRLSYTQILYIYLNRFMNEFSTIEIE